MSFRDLRNHAEMLRSLGFPRQISIENFRNPNFPLVAEILIWLVQRFDQDVRIPTDIEGPQDRVIFIRTVAQLMATKANVKMNTKKLYQADGFAVQEILKALSLLYSALQSHQIKEDDEQRETIPNYDFSNKLNDMKQIRSLASSITQKGAVIYDLLRSEIDLREQRNNVINRQLELSEAEQGLTMAKKAVENESQDLQHSISNVATDEANLASKIEKKSTALERSQKRLQTLKKVRPAFMDEYEKLQTELKKNYDTFTRRFLSLSHLEQQIEEQDLVEIDRITERESSKKSNDKIHGAALSLSGFGQDDDSDDDDDLDDDDDDDLDDEDDDLALKDLIDKPATRPLNSPKSNGRKVFGTMTGDSDSLDSEGEINLEDGERSDMPPKRPSGVKGKNSGRASQTMSLSQDDDF